MLDDEMIADFRLEATEMFDESEDGFLKIEKGGDFQSVYNEIFRAFHSLKGASGMFGFTDLQSHMHKLESLFEQFKGKDRMEKVFVDYFLRGIDAAKEIFDGESVEFSYIENISDVSASQISAKEKKEEAPPATAPAPEIKKASPPAPTPEVKKEAPVTTKEFKRESLVSQFMESQKDKKPEKFKCVYEGCVFIVDDEEDFLEVLSDIVKSGGYEVYSFLKAKDLLEKLDEVNPDVILSDINMGEMSGIELARILAYQKNQIPMIFVSGHITKANMLEGMNLGIHGFIEKPFNDYAVLNLCKNAASRSQAIKLLNKSIDYIMYMFSDLDLYLKKEGKDSIRVALKAELDNILKNKKTIFSLKK